MLSSTVIHGKTDRPWKTSAFVGNLPGASSVPVVGLSSPARMRSSVVFPQPEGPTIARNSPVRISSDTSSSALRAPDGDSKVRVRLVDADQRVAGTDPSPVVRSCSTGCVTRGRIGATRQLP